MVVALCRFTGLPGRRDGHEAQPNTAFLLGLCHQPRQRLGAGGVTHEGELVLHGAMLLNQLGEHGVANLFDIKVPVAYHNSFRQAEQHDGRVVVS
jgi:hypothetical protein